MKHKSVYDHYTKEDNSKVWSLLGYLLLAILLIIPHCFLITECLYWLITGEWLIIGSWVHAVIILSFAGLVCNPTYYSITDKASSILKYLNKRDEEIKKQFEELKDDN